MKHTKLTLALCAVALLFTSCTQMFERNIDIGSKKNASLASLISTTSAAELDTPEQIFVSKAQDANTIQISWSAVDNAASYKLERAVVDPTDLEANDPPEDEDFSVLRAQLFTTSYSDTVLSSDATYSATAYQNGYKYYYRVTAENAADGYTSGVPTDNDVYGTLLNPVKTVKASLGTSTEDVGITWTSVTGASKYEVYRSRYSDGSEPTLLGSVRSNLLSYTNDIDSQDQGVEFYYTVKAITSQSNSSVSSPVAMGYALTEGAPGSPSMQQNDEKTRGVESQIVISWEGVTTTGTTLYTVYYSTSEDSSLVVAADKLTATTYTFTKAKTGIYYYFYVKAYYIDDDGNKVNGAMSTVDYECFLLSPTTSVTATKIPGTVETHNLSFSEAIGSTEEQAQYTYKIYGSDTQNGTYDLLTSVTNANATDGYIDAVITDTRTFYYITTSYHAIESKASTIVSPVPYAPSSIKATKDEAIENTSATYTVAFADGGPSTKGVMPIKITWTASSSNDASGYVVYRAKWNSKKNAYGGFSKISDVLSSSTFSYIDADESFAPEEIYGYKVMAVNVLGKGASSSTTDAAWGYGALCAEQFMAEVNVTTHYAQRPASQGGGLVSLNKTSDTDKMTNGNWEYNYGQVSGVVAYNAVLTTSGSVMGADVDMPYTDYADFYVVTPDGDKLPTVVMNGKCNTFAGADLLAGFVIKGGLYGTMVSTGMYSGTIVYGNKKGDYNATVGTKSDGTSGVNGGFYRITTSGYDTRDVDWTWGE